MHALLYVLAAVALVRDRKGRDQRRKTPTGAARLPNLSKFYRFKPPPIRAGEFEFSLQLLRGRGRPALSLDGYVESFEWNDEGSVLTGSMTVRRPDPDRPSVPSIGHGHRVRCRIRWGGGWYELWTMRCKQPEVTKFDSVLSVELTDDLDLLRRNRRDWHFRRTKRRRRGWFCHEVARAVAKREGVKVGELAKGKHRMKKLDRKDRSALDVLREAYRHESERTGVRYIIRMRRGRLEVVPYRRNTMLYVLSDAIEDATLAQAASDHPVTVIEGRARIGTGKKAKKIRHTEMRRSVVRRFGYVHRTKDYGRVDSRSELRQRVRRDYAKAIRVRRTGTVTTPLIPFIRRGEGCRFHTNEPGWSGKAEHSRDRSFVFVTAARHRVSSAEQTSEFEISQQDPFHKDKERLEREQRSRKRKERKRRKAKAT